MLKSIDSSSLRIQRNLTYLLMNYIHLVPGVPTRMHFTDDYYIKRRIMDKELGKPKWVESHVFWCDEEDGLPAAKQFSILSQKLDAHLEPWFPNQEYTRYDFIITEMGAGFYKDWNVQAILRPE